MRFVVAMGRQSVTTRHSSPSQSYQLTLGALVRSHGSDPMRRAGRVLEGGESFDSSGFSLAGQDELAGRLNAMSGLVKGETT